MRHPRRHPVTALMAGWLPRGFISTEPIKRLVEAFIPGDWPDHPSYWAVAADYADGRRVPFGRPGEPHARVADAVAASCAIPAFYHPQTIQGRRYIDGGVCSPSNVDLLAHRDLDLIVCLNPMSSMAQITGGSAGDRVGALMRTLTRRRLDHELEKVRASGTEVLCLEPTHDDVKIMGLNMMSSARRTEVADTARETTARTLRELRRRRRDAARPRSDPRVVPRRLIATFGVTLALPLEEHVGARGDAGVRVQVDAAERCPIESESGALLRIGSESAGDGGAGIRTRIHGFGDRAHSR